MFKVLQKFLIGITMSLGVLLVALVTTIGGFLFFGYDKLTTFLTEQFSGEAVIQEVLNLMNENEELLQNQVGLGMFIAGVIILGGIIVFGILGAMFNKKSA